MLKSVKVSTPGRICMFGEHQDYLNLPVVASAISLRITIVGIRRSDLSVNLDLPDIDERISFSMTGELTYAEGKDYFRSAVNVLRRSGLTFSTGFDCTVKGKIPINAGTSSSSALVVTWVNFLAQMSDQELELTPQEIAEYAYQAEVLEFSEAGGMMDQYSTAIGGVIYLDSQPKVIIERLNADLEPFVLADSEELKNTQEILSLIKAQVFEIVGHIKEKKPNFLLSKIRSEDVHEFAYDLTTEQFEFLKGTVRNHEITLEARELFKRKPLNHKRVGELLNEHQAILRDVLQISTPKIDRMITAALEAGAYGAKINGSGGGGCMFAYAPQSPRQVLEAIARAGGKTYLVSVDDGTQKESESS